MSIPAHVTHVMAVLRENGYQTLLVGGCVRDALLRQSPSDWDVITDAVPEQIQQLFAKTVAVGAAFGTVVVCTPQPVEVTTFRKDVAYHDRRRPCRVLFTESVQEDLARRDFTMNAIAWDPISAQLIDPYAGEADLQQKLIRTVGDAHTRFSEDALRLLRAVRFACQLDLDMESDTWAAAEGAAHLVECLSKERVRDELLRILASPDPGRGLWMLYELGILLRVIPELRGSERLAQGKRNAPTLLDHLIQTAAACPDDPLLRLAGLLHDTGKLHTREVCDTGQVLFHGHEAESARIAESTLQRLRFDAHSVTRVVSLIRHHMAHGPVTRKTIRRWLSAYDEQWVRQTMALRHADHLASGGQRAPWLNDVLCELEAVLAEEGALHPRDLCINGDDVMAILDTKPGPVVGYVLKGLFDLILDDPTLNSREALLPCVSRLAAEFVKKDAHSGQSSLGSTPSIRHTDDEEWFP